MNNIRSCRPAVFGWVAVALTVVGYDAWALLSDRETLSGAFWRARGHPRARYFAVGVWTGLTWHLLLGDKRFTPTRISDKYRHAHPLWALNARLKRDSQFNIYVDSSGAMKPLITSTDITSILPTNHRGYPKRRLH